MGDSYRHLEGFLAEMAGQQTGLNGRDTKLAWIAGQKISSKATSRGHWVFEVSKNKRVWLFLPNYIQ